MRPWPDRVHSHPGTKTRSVDNDCHKHCTHVRRLSLFAAVLAVLAHRAHASRAKVVTSSVYELPRAIGPVDVSTFGAVLLHVRDPFLALQRALCHTRERVVVTDLEPESVP